MDASTPTDAGATPEDAAPTPEDTGITVLDASAEEDAGAVAMPRTCLSPMGAIRDGSDTWMDTRGNASVSVDDVEACHRIYTLRTTAPLRDGRPDNPRTVTERNGQPTVRTGHDMFDALHALALVEVTENSVSAISDGAFNEGMPVECGEGGCFETGLLWNYVWTRDTAYAVDLGLAALDPVRARNSLEFKLSERRGGGGEQIVQDTGTGGSYPVSTDRVAWALGAWAVLVQLDGDERSAFETRMYTALRNTIEHDRIVVFDSIDGLYHGEQSFLDWREQTYPEWTTQDVVHIAMSKALSTNLLHLRAIEIAAELARLTEDPTNAERYTMWATELRASIRTGFAVEDNALLSTYRTTTLDPAPVRRFDLLASSFSLLFDVGEADPATAVGSYPLYGPGAAVVWPQQQFVPIYHNRGEWPFVTAYWLRAAAHADHDAVAHQMTTALVRGAAINLSNMENFEAQTGAAYLSEGTTSGPVVNSQRQLWSVAGYVSMVHHTLFGMHPQYDSLEVAPYIPHQTRRDLFGGTDQLVLNDYPYRGKTVSVVLHLPAVTDAPGSLRVDRMLLNGSVIDSNRLETTTLDAQNRLDIYLNNGETRTERMVVRHASDTDWRNLYGPRTPSITSIGFNDGRVRMTVDPARENTAEISYNIYRDGVRIARDLPGDTTSWVDMDSDTGAAVSPCYAIETCFATGNCSQHSEPSCFWGESDQAVASYPANQLTMMSATALPSTAHGRYHYEPWGEAGDTLSLDRYVANRTGRHLIQVTYGNGAGAINTGITCAIKRVVVYDQTSTVVGQGTLVMPHLGTWSRWADSNFVEVDLEAGQIYSIIIQGDDDMVNMSAFAHFNDYTAGLGGRSGIFNRVNISELRVLAR